MYAWFLFSLEALVKVLLNMSAFVYFFGKGLGGRPREFAYRSGTGSTWLARKEHLQPDSEKHILCSLLQWKAFFMCAGRQSLGSSENNVDIRLL